MNGVTEAPKLTEARGFVMQNRLGMTATARQSAIAECAAQMPKASRSTYLKATRGKASPRMAIKAFCMECVNWERKEVRLCTATACALWAYRPFVEGEQ